MIGPARGDGGGLDAASALAFQLVEDALAGKALGARVRASLLGDLDGCAAFKLGVSVRALRRACNSGKADAVMLRKICLVNGVNGHWLLTGQGSMRAPDLECQTHEEIQTAEVLAAIEQRLDRLQQLVDSARAQPGADEARRRSRNELDFL